MKYFLLCLCFMSGGCSKEGAFVLLKVESFASTDLDECQNVLVTVQNRTGADVSVLGINVPCEVKLKTQVPVHITNGSEAEFSFLVPESCRGGESVSAAFITSPREAAIFVEL